MTPTSSAAANREFADLGLELVIAEQAPQFLPRFACGHPSTERDPFDAPERICQRGDLKTGTEVPVNKLIVFTSVHCKRVMEETPKTLTADQQPCQNGPSGRGYLPDQWQLAN